MPLNQKFEKKMTFVAYLCLTFAVERADVLREVYVRAFAGLLGDPGACNCTYNLKMKKK